MAMSYPQQPHHQQHPQAYPPPPAPPTPPTRPKWFKTTLVILGFVAVFVIGVAAGSGTDSGSTSARETVTVTAPADDAPSAETAQVEAPPAKPAGPARTMESGVYQVGVDVQAGQYKTTGSENGIGCYWARLKNDSGEFDAIISNGNLEGPGSFTINDGEFVELNGDCTWTKVG